MSDKKKIWTCKIGEVEEGVLALGADAPMRDAARNMYRSLTGREPNFIFSGWGGELTESERAVHENRLPLDANDSRFTRFKRALEALCEEHRVVLSCDNMRDDKYVIEVWDVDGNEQWRADVVVKGTVLGQNHERSILV